MGKRIEVAGIPEGFSEHTRELGEVTLNYVVGPDHGPPLLLIPGQMESWQGYKLVMPALANNYRVFVPDLRGHGKSTRTPGRYSYNLCGGDLQRFIRAVIGAPTLVAGLSSGGVLAIWLGAYAAEDVLAIIAEDPPIFSSLGPRIRNEPYLRMMFEVAVETLGAPGGRDVEAYFRRLGMPVPGESELRKIPSFIVTILFAMARLNRRLRPDRPYDVPLLPFHMRAGLAFISEYDPDFSRATADGSLGDGFDPDDALARIECPMLLMRVRAIRHESWGILGAIDDDDLERIRAAVKRLSVVEFEGRHEIHMTEPERYVAELERFVGGLELAR